MAYIPPYSFFRKLEFKLLAPDQIEKVVSFEKSGKNKLKTVVEFKNGATEEFKHKNEAGLKSLIFGYISEHFQ